MSTDKELYKLELLSLVSRVSQELFNHTKLQDKNLAEFVIAVSLHLVASIPADLAQLHEQSKNLPTFQTKLGEIGADFPEWFVKNLDRLIVTMHPKYKRKAAKAKAAAAKSAGVTLETTDETKNLQSRKFPGLSVPDSAWTPAEKYLEDRDRKELPETKPSLFDDDPMAQLSAIGARRSRPAAEDYIDGEPFAKRGRDNGYARNARDQGSNGHARDNGYADRGRPRPTIDDRPVLYKIYDGTVNNVRDFGAFVVLEGVAGRTEGM
jgi:ATP-dependent RNA helicase DHX8/PRP22